MRTIAVERISETKKRLKDDVNDVSKKQSKKQRSSGGDTEAYLLEKKWKKFPVEKSKIDLKREELEFNWIWEQNAQAQNQQMQNVWNSQIQSSSKNSF